MTLVLLACGGGGTPGPATGVPAPTGAAPTSSATSSPAARLTAALDGLAGGYDFDARVTVDGQAVTTVRGRSVAGASEFTVTIGGTDVMYRLVPPKAWRRETGGTWAPLAGDAPVGDPLAALRSPTRLGPGGTTPVGESFAATYPAGALGLDGTTEVPVDLVLTPGGALVATYRMDTGGGAAVSTTTLTPATDREPIGAPAS